jgi:hypothetical protein
VKDFEDQKGTFYGHEAFSVFRAVQVLELLFFNFKVKPSSFKRGGSRPQRKVGRYVPN